jgi:hypothetical protein
MSTLEATSDYPEQSNFLKLRSPLTSQHDHLSGRREISVSARTQTPFTGFYPVKSVMRGVSAEPGTRQTQHLPFRVILARTDDQLRRAVAVRASAFGRKSLELATILGQPEPADLTEDSIVLIAEDKVTGNCVGTMRIATNLRRPLDIESIEGMPEQVIGRRVARAERLGIATREYASLVKVALFKALHRYCLALQIEWIVVQVTPPRDKDYRALGFFEILPDAKFESFIIPGVKQICLAFNAESAERRFKSVDHMLYEFMFATWHPDIDVFSSIQSQWARPRRQGADEKVEKFAPNSTHAQPTDGSEDLQMPT